MTQNEAAEIVAKEAKSAEPKRHHYVPRFYLKGFTGQDGRLFGVNRPIGKSFRTAPDNVAGENFFNRIEIKNMDPNEIEKALSSFESEVAPALERIKEAKSLAKEDDRSLLLNFLAAIALRNPWRREAISEIHNQATRQQLAAKFGTKEAWTKSVDEMKAAGIWEEAAGVTFEDMQGMLKDAKFPMPKMLNMIVEIDQHDHLTELLWNRKWQIVCAQEGTGGFVTTDDPVCLRWTDGQPHGGLSPGFALKETEIIFPLSPSLVLRGSFEGEENMTEANAETVGTINSLIIINAQNQVYARDYSFKFMRKEPKELASGATLEQNQWFLEAGRRPEDGKIVPLPSK
jgi:hypothetical protein